MPGKYLVSTYMQKDVHTVSKNATFREALEKMVSEKTNGLVVINGNQQVTGIISCWDLIQYVVPDYLENERHVIPFEAGSVFAERVKAVADDPVTKFMTKKVVCVKESHTLMEAAAMLSEYRIRQLPVVNEDSVLVGYINRTDIKQAMADVLA